jgi:hypothetical protein
MIYRIIFRSEASRLWHKGLVIVEGYEKTYISKNPKTQHLYDALLIKSMHCREYGKENSENP